MRNAGLSEARCQNEVSESKAPAASNVTSKVRRSRIVTEFSPSKRCAHWGLKDRQWAAPIAARRTKSMPGTPVAGDGARLFDNGSVFGVRWEAQRHTAFLCSASRAFANHLALNAPEDHTGMEKRRHHFALPAQSKMRLGIHDDAIVRLIDLL
jgi:hypothetical protein